MALDSTDLSQKAAGEHVRLSSFDQSHPHLQVGSPGSTAMAMSCFLPTIRVTNTTAISSPLLQPGWGAMQGWPPAPTSAWSIQTQSSAYQHPRPWGSFMGTSSHFSHPFSFLHFSSFIWPTPQTQQIKIQKVYSLTLHPLRTTSAAWRVVIPFSPLLRIHQQSLRREKPSALGSIRQALRQIIALLMPISPPCLHGSNGFVHIHLSRDTELI